MSASEPTLAFTGAQGRLASVLLPTLAKDYPTLTISRELAPATQSAALVPTQSSQTWQQFFTQAPSPSLRVIIHAAWSNTPITAEHSSQASEPTHPTESADLQLLSQLCKHLLQSPQPARLIFFSSGSVYGQTSLAGANESTQVQPLGRYAREKLAAEALLQDYVAKGLPVTTLRISNPYGFPFEAGNPQGVIGHAIHHLQTGDPFTLWGENPVKDYLHSDDLSRALQLLLKNPLDGIWNLSSGHGTDLKQILECLQALSGKKLQLKHEPAHAWDATPSVLNSQALQHALDWQPQIPLELGLTQVLQSFSAR